MELRANGFIHEDKEDLNPETIVNERNDDPD
jgi:hypothetical protein